MPSFDTVCEANLVDVKNGVDNTIKEISTRFDFKGTSASIEIKDKEITMIGDADFQLTQILDVLRNKLTKRNVDVRFLDMGDVQKMGGDKVKQIIKVRNGIETEMSKKIQRLIKDSKLKVQAAIQGDAVRVTGAKRDDLQAAMALIKKDIADVPLSFNNQAEVPVPASDLTLTGQPVAVSLYTQTVPVIAGSDVVSCALCRLCARRIFYGSGKRCVGSLR